MARLLKCLVPKVSDMRRFLRRATSIVSRGGLVDRVSTDKLEALLVEIFAKPASSLRQSRTLATYVPRWAGVSSATLGLFDRCLPVPLSASQAPWTITQKEIEAYAAAISALPIETLVISGGDAFTLNLLKEVQLRRPDIDGRLLWHSNFLQMGEEHDWKRFKLWLDAAHNGLISRFGVVKKGLDDFLSDFGVSSVFVQNRVRTVPDAPRGYTTARDRVGIWLSGSSHYRKIPYNVLCGLRLLDGIRLTGAGFDDRALSLVAKLGLPRNSLEQEPISRSELLARIPTTALSLYVTISECMPMLPLESIGVGVPCLIGASSHFLRDDPELAHVYVVEKMAEPLSIARKIRHALDVGERMFPTLSGYVRRWNANSVEFGRDSSLKYGKGTFKNTAGFGATSDDAQMSSLYCALYGPEVKAFGPLSCAF